jgi:hypothetical protein
LKAFDVDPLVHLLAVASDRSEGAAGPRLANRPDKVAVFGTRIEYGAVGGWQLKRLR